MGKKSRRKRTKRNRSEIQPIEPPVEIQVEVESMWKQWRNNSDYTRGNTAPGEYKFGSVCDICNRQFVKGCHKTIDKIVKLHYKVKHGVELPSLMCVVLK